MTKHQFDDPLKELEAALAIEPSPAFAVRVRAAIETSSLSSSWMWTGAVAGGTLLAGFIALSVWAGRMAELATPPAISSTDMSVRIQVREPDILAQIAGLATPTVAIRAPERPGPDLVLLTNQPAVLRAMWESVESGRVNSVPETALDELARVTPAPLKVLTIAAVSIPKIVITPIDSDDKE